VSATLALARRWAPFLAWREQLTRASLRADLEAGLISAVLILPQAIALASLAGMPPETGIYASIVPVIVAALWGSSWHALSGPNTAVCVLLASSLAPFASPGSDAYVGYALTLTFLVGAIGLTVGALRLGGLLDFISQTVIAAIVLAVGLMIVVYALSAFLGVLANPAEPFFIRFYQIVHDLPRANGYVVAVGATTVAVGLMARRWARRYALLLGVAAGSLLGNALNLLLGPATTAIESLGRLSLSYFPWSWPRFDLESLWVIQELLASAFAIAFLGLMQSVVIARALAERSGQRLDTNQEIVGQGLANIVASFFSSFAGSGSFNRSAAHYEAGAHTPMAAVYASLALALIVFAAAPLIAYLPIPAVAGALVLVGIGLLDVRELKRLRYSRQETAIFVLTFSAALASGLNAGVLTGVLVSLAVYLRYAAKPNISIEDYPARDGRRVYAVTVNGSLFFGSLRTLEHAFAAVAPRAGESAVLLLHTDHVTYLDVPGAAWLAAEAERWRRAGVEFYVHVTRAPVLDTLDRSGALVRIGADHVIQRDRGHPMKAVLFPQHVPVAPARETATPAEAAPSTHPGEPNMDEIARRLRASRLLSLLSHDQLRLLLAHSELRQAREGEVIIAPDTSLDAHLVLIEGELEIERLWVGADGREQASTRRATPQTASGEATLVTATRGLRVTARRASRYLLINADRVDELLEWSQQVSSVPDEDARIKRRMAIVKQVSVFRQLPLENARAAFEHMRPQVAAAGETIIHQGERGDRYYLIESGEAEVWRTDPLTDATACVAVLGPGDAFGEEALLQEGFRNATVRMLTPGRLLTLNKEAFDALVRPGLVQEVAPESAQALAATGHARWLDCRYDMEYEEGRIPGAQLVPLDQLRETVAMLDPAAMYIVYCRSGRRSRAAAFLLRERNIHAVSLAGGVKAWPYEIDTRPLEHEAALT